MKDTKDTAHCYTCRFWDQYKEHGVVQYDIRQDTPAMGYCRYFPPERAFIRTRWPETSEYDFCGKHQPE